MGCSSLAIPELAEKAKASCVIRLGRAYFKQEKFDEAIEQWRAALAIPELAEKAKASCFILLGRVYFKKERFPEATTQWRAAIDIPELAERKRKKYSSKLQVACIELQNRLDKVQILIDKARTDREENNFAGAIENYEAALATKEYDGRERVHSMTELAMCYTSIRNFDKAIKTSLLLLSEKGVTEELKGRIYPNLGYFYYMNKQYDVSIDYYEKAIKTQQLSEKHKAGIYAKMAQIYCEQENYNNAIEYYSYALKIPAMTGLERGTILLNLGNVHLQKNDPKKAMELWSEALVIPEFVGEERAICLDNLGDFYALKNYFKMAVEVWDEVLTIREFVGEERATCLNKRNIIQEKLEQQEQQKRVTILLKLGTTSLEKDNLEGAQKFFTEAQNAPGITEPQREECVIALKDIENRLESSTKKGR